MRSGNKRGLLKWIALASALLIIAAGVFAGFAYFAKKAVASCNTGKNSNVQNTQPLSGSRAMPCPPGAGKCLGVREGDIDGDGQCDQVGVTYASGSSVTIHVVFSTGRSIQFVTPAQGDTYALGFFGLADMDGDGRDEIYIYRHYLGTGGSRKVEAYEFKQGSLQQLHNGPWDNLFIDDSSVQAGFACRQVNGKFQIATIEGDNGSEQGGIVDETVYQPDSNGIMRQISQREVLYGYSDMKPMLGAHCPGLDVWGTDAVETN